MVHTRHVSQPDDPAEITYLTQHASLTAQHSHLTRWARLKITIANTTTPYSRHIPASFSRGARTRPPLVRCCCCRVEHTLTHSPLDAVS